jgi:general stress protein 26
VKARAMKTEVQPSPAFTRLCALIENIPVAMLTTLDAQGQLVSRPMTPLLMDAAGALWFFIDLRSTPVDQLHSANLSFADSCHASYVSLAGFGRITADAARTQELWTPLAKTWFPDGPESADLGLLRFVPTAAEYWDAPSSKMVRMVALAASIVAGRPLGLGEHESFDNLARSAQATAPG